MGDIPTAESPAAPPPPLAEAPPPQGRPRRRRWVRRIVWLTLSLLGSYLVLVETPAGVQAATVLWLWDRDEWALGVCRLVEGANLGMPRGFQAHGLEVSILQGLAASDKRRVPEVLDAIARHKADAEGGVRPSEVVEAVSEQAELYAEQGRPADAATLLLAELRKHLGRPWLGPHQAQVIEWLADVGDNAQAIEVFEECAGGEWGQRDAERAVAAAWRAFRGAGREKEGRAHLLHLQQVRAGTPLAAAIRGVLDTDGPAGGE